jgi:hypothetical protein
MKTLAQITLAALMITMAHTASATAYRKFRMQIAQDKEIYVLSKLENIVEEFLPYAPAVSRHITPELMIHLQEEATTEEDLPFSVCRKALITDEEVADLVRSMQSEEAVVNDLNIDTKAVVTEIREESTFELTTEILSGFIKEERDVTEDPFLLTMTNRNMAK